jgi:4-aminobutyrate aminotransferase-like enzyme
LHELASTLDSSHDRYPRRSHGFVTHFFQVGTERKVITDLPGPKSQELHARRKAAVSAGLTVGFPIYIERAEGAILVDVDGNRTLDLGSGIAVTGIGHAVPASSTR